MSGQGLRTSKDPQLDEAEIMEMRGETQIGRGLAVRRLGRRDEFLKGGVPESESRVRAAFRVMPCASLTSSFKNACGQAEWLPCRGTGCAGLSPVKDRTVSKRRGS